MELSSADQQPILATLSAVDILAVILSYLPSQNVVGAARTCKAWAVAAKRPFLWEILFHQEYDSTPTAATTTALPALPPGGWLNAFKQMKLGELNMKKGAAIAYTLSNTVDLQHSRYPDSERVYPHANGHREGLIINSCYSPCWWNSYTDDRVVRSEYYDPNTGVRRIFAEGNTFFFLCGNYVVWTIWKNRYYFSGPIWLSVNFARLDKVLAASETNLEWWRTIEHEKAYWNKGGVSNEDYDPDSYNNPYEIRAIPNQNAKAPLLCISELPGRSEVAYFQLKVFYLSLGGELVYQNRIRCKNASIRILGFHSPYLVYSYQSPTRKRAFEEDHLPTESEVPRLHQVRVLDISKPISPGDSDEYGRVIYCPPEQYDIACASGSFSIDGTEFALLEAAEDTANLVVLSLTNHVQPLVQRIPTPKFARRYHLSVLKIALCRDKAAIIGSDGHLVAQVSLYGRHSGQFLGLFHFRSYGFHTLSPFCFVNPNKLIAVGDDVDVLDFTPSNRLVKIGLIPVSTTPFSLLSARVPPERVQRSIMKYFRIFNSPNAALMRSYIISETATVRIILIVLLEETPASKANVCATEILSWRTTKGVKAREELPSGISPLNGRGIGAAAENFPSSYSDSKEFKRLFSTLPKSVNNDAFLVCYGYGNDKWEMINFPDTIPGPKGNNIPIKWAGEAPVDE